MAKILITAAGSYGDIAPYTGLGARLRAAGHEVALATHDSYAPLVRAAGLEFRRLPADPRTRRVDPADPADATGPARPPAPGGTRALMRQAAAFIKELGGGLADAARDDTDLLLLSATTAPLGHHLAEASGIPSLELPLVPAAPTGDFGPVVSGGRSLGRWGNRAAGRLSLRVIDRLYADAAREMRARLGLPAAPHPVRSAAAPRPPAGRSCTASARSWCPAPPTGAPASTSWGTGGPGMRRTTGSRPSSRTSWPRARRRSSSASAAWRAARANA